MDDDAALRSQRQRVRHAARPIGSTGEVTAELERLQQQVEDAREALVAYRRIHRRATAFPWFFPSDERRTTLQRLANRWLASVENHLGQDVLAIVHRASSIVQQLRARAANVDADTLLCSDLAEALVMQAWLEFDSPAPPELRGRIEPAAVIDGVVAALAEVTIPRIDHGMDGLIEQARTVAEMATSIYVDCARSQATRVY